MSGRLLLRWRRAPPPAAGPDGEDEDEEEQDADGGWLSAACPPIMAAAAAALVGLVGLGSLVLPLAGSTLHWCARGLCSRPVNSFLSPPVSVHELLLPCG